MSVPIYIGTAGWGLPSESQECFPGKGTHLERYARRFNAVGINSSFYRNHKPETYAKWARAVPEGFAFSVKLLRLFTHEKRLQEPDSRLEETFAGIRELGRSWKALLVQLPPSLVFDRGVADRFFSRLRKAVEREVVVEPRHKTWAEASAVSLLAHHGISKVQADPEPCFVARAVRAQVARTLYYRLHGSPEMYKSLYTSDVIERVARRLGLAAGDAWCIFDNTTYGHATTNALELAERVATSGSAAP